MSSAVRLSTCTVLLYSFFLGGCAEQSAGLPNEIAQQGSGSGGRGSGTDAGTGTGSGPSVVVATCGNSKLDGEETCDDGNVGPGDGCSPACKVEPGYQCPDLGKACVVVSVCGNGILTPLEACDDGNTNDGDGCKGDCLEVTSGWQCRVPGRPCVPLCGDSVKTAGENCDDGNANSGDGCSSTCLIEPGWSCNGTTCKKSVCGNSELEAGESCDKGSDNGLFYGDGSGCSKTCTQEPTCRNSNGETGACTQTCGDGNRDSGEACDDGNRVSGDGCSDSCQTENGFTCTDQQFSDAQPCPSASSRMCLVLPVIYRDFDGAQAGGHPDFFFVGSAGPNGQTTICVPNASGAPAAVGTDNKCANTDATGPCQGLVQNTLGRDGKPQLNTGRSGGLTCNCRFTDWDATGILNSQTQITPTSCWDDGGNERKRIGFSTTFPVQVIKDAASFGQWYNDSSTSTKVMGTLELAQNGTQFQFSSSTPGAAAGAAGRTVYDDLHAIFMKTQTQLTSGFFPLENQSRTKVCNIWPYWVAALQSNCNAGDGYPVASQWDPLGSYNTNPPTAGTGGPVKPVQGLLRNFYFTTEVRYLFRYDGTGGSLSFFGDDDVWVFVNGRLALDLGAPHERIQGTVAVNNTFGLETGKTYEIAVFHADRHPRESNYQLTLTGFSTTRSSCQPKCGDGVVTAGEECDLGQSGNTGGYGGCTSECKFGPFCGDGQTQDQEECDSGRDNGAVYSKTCSSGCSTGCKKSRCCGDGIVDPTYGEQCDSTADCNTDCKKSVE